MPFDVITRTALEYYTAHPPATEDVWYGPWIAILTTLFPSTQGYIVTPQRRLPPPPDDDAESHIPDLVIEVVTLSLRLSTAAPPARPGGLTFRTVLIVKVKKLPALASKPFFNNNGSSIDKLMLRSRALLTQNCTGLARSDLIGGTEKRRTMGKIYVRSLTGSIPLTTKPRLMTFEFLPTWSLRCDSVCSLLESNWPRHENGTHCWDVPAQSFGSDATATSHYGSPAHHCTELV